SQVLADGEPLVRMDRAVKQKVTRSESVPASFVKLDGAPDVEFQGYQYFGFPTDHSEFTESGIIGNPFRATAAKGDATYQRFAEHLAAALDEFMTVEVDVHTRDWSNRA